MRRLRKGSIEERERNFMGEAMRRDEENVQCAGRRSQDPRGVKALLQAHQKGGGDGRWTIIGSTMWSSSSSTTH